MSDGAARLVAAVEDLLAGRDFRRGRMFGNPAFFLGRSMFACVHGGGVGLRVPADAAALAVETGRAVRFRPHGRAPMREWIEVRPDTDGGLAAGRDLLLAAHDAARGRVAAEGDTA